jgi:hypothetical protein
MKEQRTRKKKLSSRVKKKRRSEEKNFFLFAARPAVSFLVTIDLLTLGSKIADHPFTPHSIIPAPPAAAPQTTSAAEHSMKGIRRFQATRKQSIYHASG